MPSNPAPATPQKSAPATPKKSAPALPPKPAPSSKTSPLSQGTSGPATERRQAQLKTLVELEVSGLVFQHENVPYLFFPRDPELVRHVPSYGSVKSLVTKLKAVREEREAYHPLSELFNHVVNEVYKKTKPSRRIAFIVYDREMDGRFDGAGNLKPDVLGSDQPLEEDVPVPWIAVYIAVEVKDYWADALRQALTYARSMLAVGDKWFSLVLVYNRVAGKLCFCFATRQGVYLSPAWSLGAKAGFEAAACALVHICHSDGPAAGKDPSRFIDEAGRLNFAIPGLGLVKSVDDLYHQIKVAGRATHVHLVELNTSFEPPADGQAKDPVELDSQLETTELGAFRVTDVDEAARQAPVAVSREVLAPSSIAGPVTRSRTGATAPAQPAPSVAPPVALPVAPSAPAIREQILELLSQQLRAPTSPGTLELPDDWQMLCAGTSPYWISEQALAALREAGARFVLKITWVRHERRNIETKVHKATDGCYGLVQCAGHMIVSHPGLQRLSFFDKPNTRPFVTKLWKGVYSRGQGPTYVRRLQKVMILRTVGDKIDDIGEDAVLSAHAFKDIVTAIYILFHRGFLHRDIYLGNLLKLTKPITRSREQVIDHLKPFFGDDILPFVDLFSTQYACLCDFDHAVEWKVPRTTLGGRSGTCSFFAAARMSAWVGEVPDWDDTPMDDLEALSMALFYNTLRANIDDATEMEHRHYESFHSDELYHLCATKHMFLSFTKETGNLKALRKTWPLWWRVFEVATKARQEVTELKKSLNGSSFAAADAATKAALEALCKRTALDYIRAVDDALKDPAFNV